VYVASPIISLDLMLDGLSFPPLIRQRANDMIEIAADDSLYAEIPVCI
jgi:hypothetical protein